MPRILVLDDEPLISMMLQDWLSELACETIGPAGSVQGALVLIEDTPPDAAILDLSLGDERSYAVATALRARRIPFAFATGYGDKSVIAAFKDEMILSKPFDFNAIKNVLATLLGSACP
jgi:CheY-like chemotaxis protein